MRICIGRGGKQNNIGEALSLDRSKEPINNSVMEKKFFLAFTIFFCLDVEDSDLNSHVPRLPLFAFVRSPRSTTIRKFRKRKKDIFF